MLQAFLSGIPVVAIVKDIPEAFYMILTVLLFGICMAVLMLIFLPKILMQRTYAKMTLAEQNKAMAVSVQLSAGQKYSQNVRDISGLGSAPGSSSGKKDCGSVRFMPPHNKEERDVGDGSRVVSNECTDGAAEDGMTNRTNDDGPLAPEGAVDATEGDTGQERRSSEDHAEQRIPDGGALVRRLDIVGGPAVHSSYIDDEPEKEGI